MPKYRLAQRSYFDAAVQVADGGPAQAGVLLEVGTVIEFAGIPAPHMEPLDDEAKAARAKFDAAVREGLKPISKEEQLDLEAVNPLQPPEMQREAAALRKEQREAEAEVATEVARRGPGRPRKDVPAA